MNSDIEKFRKHIEKIYQACPTGCGGSFEEILCYELHTQPVNPRMKSRTLSEGYETGLTFDELAQKWGVSIAFLGEVIAEHCKRIEQ